MDVFLTVGAIVNRDTSSRVEMENPWVDVDNDINI
jgi:hypothetical protein